MYSQANVREESVLRPPTRALPSVIVDTEKVLREADGPEGEPARSPKITSAYAVFTEPGSSASQMTAAKIMDIISRLPGCDGQVADAVSAYTQVKMEDAHKLLKKIQHRSVQTFGFVYHDTNGQNHGPVWKTQSFLLSGICTVILWQDYCGKGNLRKFY